MRIPEERFFEASDGATLFYRYWPRVQGSGGRAIILLHRGHEHSGRFQHVVDELDLSEFQGHLPIELDGHSQFPPIGQLTYLLTGGTDYVDGPTVCGNWSNVIAVRVALTFQGQDNGQGQALVSTTSGALTRSLDQLVSLRNHQK